MKRATTMSSDEQAHTAFKSLGGVGKAAAADMVHLGFRTLDELAAADPEQMYVDLGSPNLCVLYQFRCAVYQCRNGTDAEADLCKWPAWKDRRLDEADEIRPTKAPRHVSQPAASQARPHNR